MDILNYAYQATLLLRGVSHRRPTTFQVILLADIANHTINCYSLLRTAFTGNKATLFRIQK